MSKAEDLLNILETGEPDQDYDTKFYDKVCAQLGKAGFKGCTHREFDKYQGVYITVPGFGKFWTKDFYNSGTVDKQGTNTFTYKKDTVTDHYVFTADIPLKDRQKVTLKDDFEVTEKDGKVDASEIINYLKALKKK